MSYPEDIAQLADTYITRRTPSQSIAPLAAALGCRRINVGRGGWYHQSVKQPLPGFEPLVCQTLIDALRSHVCSSVPIASEDGLSILDGLSKNNRWRAALTNIDDAYCLAALLLNTTFDGDDVCEALSRGIVNAWLLTDAPFVEYPDLETLSAAFFGDPWTSLVIGEPSFFAWDVIDTVMAMRPPFVGSLVPCQAIDGPLPLPVLGDCL